jgi:hypothetical protein
MEWKKLSYIGGVCCLVAAFGWWLISLFKLFSEFYKYDGLKLLVMPLFELFTNPLLWIGILLIKLSGRNGADTEQSLSNPNDDDH